MADIPLRITPPSLPYGYCMPGTVQGFVSDIFTGAFAWLPDDLGQIVIGPNTPTVEERGRIWFKTETTYSSIVGIFLWSPIYGIWISNHWQYKGGVSPYYERRIFVGTKTQLELYDGGEPGTVSPCTGPFWEEDTLMRDTFPLGVAATGVPAVYTDAVVFDVAGAAAPEGMRVYFIKPTTRRFDRGS
jgi:hypothetical protein